MDEDVRYYRRIGIELAATEMSFRVNDEEIEYSLRRRGES